MRTRLTAAALSLLAFASAAWSAPPGKMCPPPSLANCVLPAGILMVEGTNASGGWVIDPAGAFTVTVRDAANQPIVGCSVRVDMSNCLEFQACTGSFPGAPQCPGPIVEATTNAGGVAFFNIAGFITPGTPSTVGTGGACARITAGPNAILLGTVRVACLDLDGSVQGVDGGDIAAFNAIFTAGTIFASRADFDFSGTVTPIDLSILLGFVAAQTSLKAAPGPCCR